MTTVSIVQSTFPFLPGQKFEFIHPITLLVGDNGVGKSSMLKLIGTQDPAVIINKSCSSVVWWDSELSNPRTRNYEILDYFLQYVKNVNASEEEKIRIVKLVQEFLILNKEDSTLTGSHGEQLFPILESIRAHSGSLILLDEPEGGLSIPKIEQFYSMIKSAVSQGTEFIIATHSPVLMEAVGQVYDLVQGEYVSADICLSKIWNR